MSMNAVSAYEALFRPDGVNGASPPLSMPRAGSDSLPAVYSCQVVAQGAG